ncbi:pyrroline-5-carboxylate reductase [Candidatus Marinamargulisbacteria bacterium SCGC AG-343-D04]|nr:pyrroline-5-carboxylate reductase [Candidatus Marinamargulisbacteria bacterium SCGC AG-343-D04]
MTHLSIGFLGFGKMATAIFQGSSSFLKEKGISVYATDKYTANIERNNINFLSIEELLNTVDIVLLAIKPQQLNELADTLRSVSWEKKCLVSILAGKTLDNFHQLLENCPHLIRVMPNTAAQFNESMTVISHSSNTDTHYLDFVTDLFSCVGKVMHVDDDRMNFCTSLCGSGPAFFYALADSLVHLSTERGFSEKEARELVNQLCKGVASTLDSSSDSVSTLIQSICSPNGTTERGLATLHGSQIPDLWKAVFIDAEKRAKELSNSD